MVVVYHAANVIDAHAVRGMLEAHGINAFVTGEYLTGALGELPAAGLVTVMVDDADAASAFGLIDDARGDEAAIEL